MKELTYTEYGVYYDIPYITSQIQTPRTPAEWQSVAEGFETRWQFPNCVGCVDGKHLRIKVPSQAAVNYHNYKGYASLILLGVVNSDYSFIYVDVGSPERCADAGVWRDCDFNKVGT